MYNRLMIFMLSKFLIESKLMRIPPRNKYKGDLQVYIFLIATVMQDKVDCE